MLVSVERVPRRQRARAFYANVISAYRRGDWTAARALSDRGLEVGQAFPQLLACRAQLEFEIGNFEQGSTYLDTLIQAMKQSATETPQPFAVAALVISSVSRITGVTDRFEAAEAAAGIILSSSFDIPRFTLAARVGLGMMAVQRGDVDAVAEQYAALEPVRDTFLLPLDISSVQRRWDSWPKPWASWTWPPGILRKVWRAAAKQTTAPNWPGPAATMPTPYVNEPVPVTARGRPLCWTSRWLSLPNWVCGL